MSLEDTLRAAAKRGQLNHVSLVAHTARDKTVTFRASYRNTTGDTHKSAEDSDPVKALAQVFR